MANSKAGTTLRAVWVGSMLAFASSAAFAGVTIPPPGDITEDNTSPTIPEPTAAVVMAAGLGVVALATRLRRRE